LPSRNFLGWPSLSRHNPINYGARHRQHKPVSTATAESAVNQVINQRMCKRQQMRWSPQGVHLLAQLRCAVINGDLVKRLARYEKPEPSLSDEAAEFIKLFERTPNPIPLSFYRSPETVTPLRRSTDRDLRNFRVREHPNPDSTPICVRLRGTGHQSWYRLRLLRWVRRA
jgi:hypothetical protein